jgi:dynein heavy chain
MTGKTLLPLPADEVFINIDKSSHNKDSIHALEGAIVTWTEQIRNVLSLNSETPLLSGENPGPEVEVEFWASRAADLNSVHEQLRGPGISRIAKVLEITSSTYFPSFSRLCQEVEGARMEANENLLHLKALEPYLNRLKVDDFSSLVHLFKPILHVILLIWVHSKFFNTTARIVILIREIFNYIIKRGQEYVNSQSMFEVDAGEVVASLKDCIRICVAFKSIFCDNKSRTNIEYVRYNVCVRFIASNEILILI